MAFGVGRALSTPLMFINFCLYLVAAALAGWALNRNFDYNNGVGEGYVGTSCASDYSTIQKFMKNYWVPYLVQPYPMVV